MNSSPSSDRPAFLADNDFTHAAIVGLLRVLPEFLTAARAGFRHLSDPELLAKAASLGRILVTHDKKTMPGHFDAFLASGLSSPGVLIVSKRLTIAQIIEELAVIWAASHRREWIDRREWIGSRPVDRPR